ncbi:hypothetical protein glysoja_040315 [Glycine soja]|uniref:RRM domain-containing protein n=1 Tax=Glycine soja TaxID=3848 RepID=A0A0B2RW65_GLYSO|nr:hypothetical protein glysoja_040315 [Glycine soja]
MLQVQPINLVSSCTSCVLVPYKIKSVYVRNLSPAVSPKIEDEFKNFGRIRLDGVVIRSHKDVGVCYAFVEFEDMTGVHNAVKEDKYTLKNEDQTVTSLLEEEFSNYPYHAFFFRGWFISSTATSCFPIRNTKRSLPPKAKNLVVVWGLRAFVFGVYFYTMNGYKIFSYQKEQVKERL